MKILSRDFTQKEKTMLALLGVLLVVLLYFYLVDQPVRNNLALAESEMQSLQIELDAVNSKLESLETMKAELDALSESPEVSVMESYNNRKAEIQFINELMKRAQEYSVVFDDVTRNGDQIRRPVTMTFVAEDYQTAVDMIKQLEACKYRCQIGNVTCSSSDSDGDLEQGTVSVSLTATFFETMVGGVEDIGLPQDKSSSVAADTDVDYNALRS